MGTNDPMRFFDTTVRSFNMEITNRCTLACPECPRTGNPWVRDNLTDLTLALVRQVFPASERERYRGLRVNLCGAYGDCIYHRQFHDIVAYLKDVGLTLCVETNGSHRKAAWWERTCDLLTEDDVLTFSVDGLADTNHVYRVNARWDDIESAMRLCAARVPVDWKYIVFRHNEHQVQQAEELARDIGIRNISFKLSGRFRHDDPLAPADQRYIGVVTRNRRRIDDLRDSGGGDAALDREVRIVPKCRNGKDLAVTALGYLYPCTSCETSDTSTWFHRNREHFDLRTRTAAEILASPRWRELETLWSRASQAPASCLYYCGVHDDYVERYAADARPDRPGKPQDARHLSLR